jgi:hypothetical protein
MTGRHLLFALGAAFLTTACDPEPKPDSTGETDDTSAEVTAFFEDIEVELSSDVATVATVSWRTQEESMGSVAFWSTEGEEVVTPMETSATLEHEVVLVGSRQSTEVHFEIRAQTAGASYVSQAQSFTTGMLPAEAPAVELSVHDPEASAGGFTLVPITAGSPQVTWLCILDEEGQLVWAYPSMAVPRIRLAPDGSGLYFMQPYVEKDKSEQGYELMLVSWTGALRWSARVPDAQRDFVLLPDGSVAVLNTLVREYEGRPDPVLGDAITVVSSDGELQEIWNVFEEMGPGDCGSAIPEHGFDGYEDWSHGNYLSWSERDQAVMLVARTLNALVAVNPLTGEQVWTMAMDCGDYTGAGGFWPINNPHSVETIDGGLLVFNQGEEPDGCSGAVELAVDADAGEIRSTWSYDNEACVHIFFMGNAQQLPNGNNVITLNTETTEVARDGTPVHRFSLGMDEMFGYTERVSSLYVTPSD